MEIEPLSPKLQQGSKVSFCQPGFNSFQFSQTLNQEGKGWWIWRRMKLLLWLLPSQLVDVVHDVPWREGNLEERLSRKDIDHPLSATQGI
ncbi:uncharacterized protein [Triticum aestivum]|uniref:uncharacterized protein isoform X2 n=1 Tax=Triticum aestivum TaxID=4565 RepID=UPI001D02ED3E|nr:uncharacterized protein LOC123095010 isoform X2 [Triticum aestivum]